MQQSHSSAYGLRAFGALCVLSFLLGTQFPGLSVIPGLPDATLAQTLGIAGFAQAEKRTAVPVRLEIPAIRVHAEIEYVGTDKEGKMDVPKQWDNVGWYSPGTIPGDPGNAVIAGHLDSKTGPAVFWNLEKLQPGDRITVIDAAKLEHHFTVERLETYPIDAAPMDEIFGESDEARLNLLTCGGEWGKSGYNERIVVFAKIDLE